SLRMVIKQSLVLTLSASTGVVLYLLINHWVLVALLPMPLMWGLLSLFKMRVPAVYAFPLLAYVFPQDALPLLPIASLLVSFGSLGLVFLYRSITGSLMPMEHKI
ncbi:hypothetical protein MUA06_12830, partial [Proteus columbae]|nr:hypothetical protein [Proteus columbae]